MRMKASRIRRKLGRQLAQRRDREAKSRASLPRAEREPRRRVRRYRRRYFSEMRAAPAPKDPPPYEINPAPVSSARCPFPGVGAGVYYPPGLVLGVLPRCRNRACTARIENQHPTLTRGRGKLAPLRTMQLAREPGFYRAPIAKNGRLRNLQQLRRLGDIQAAEKAVLDHGCLARIYAREFFERRIQRDQIIPKLRPVSQRFIEGDHHAFRPAALPSISPPRRFHQHLPHRPRRNALKMQPRSGSNLGRVRQLQPSLVDQRGRIQRRARIAAPHARSQPPKFLISFAEETIERAPFLRRRSQIAGVESRPRIIDMRHDGFARAFAHCLLDGHGSRARDARGTALCSSLSPNPSIRPRARATNQSAPAIISLVWSG